MSDPAGQACLAFAAEGLSFALPMDQIREVVPLPALQPPFQATAQVAGLMNLRGQWIPVVHLASRFGLAASRARLEDHVIVVPSAAAPAPALWGLWVDQILGAMDLPAPVPPDPFALDPPQPRFLSGVITQGAHRYLVPDLAVVLDEGAPAGLGAAFLLETGLGEDLDGRFLARAEALAVPMADTRLSEETHLVVRIRQESFALPLTEVLQILPWQAPMPVPGAPPGCLGLLPHRGRAALVIDPAPILGLGGSEARTPFVVFVADGAESLGLRVDAVEGSLATEDAVLQAMPGVHPALKGRWLLQEEPLVLLDPQALARGLFPEPSFSPEAP